MDRAIRYTSAQKAVAALVAIGQPKAAELLKHLSREEVGRLMAASKTMNAVTQEGLELIVDDFEYEFTRGTGLLDSSAQIDSILTESYDAAELAALRGESKAAAPVKLVKKNAWEVLAESEAKMIVDFLTTENPQVGAYVLSRLPSARSAEILTLMERPIRSSVLARMMTLSDVSKEAEEFIEEELLRQFGQVGAGSNKATLARVATILNELDRESTDEVLGDLSASIEAAEMSTVKSMLFRFEDIIALAPVARTAVFDSMQTDRLTLALREAAPDLAEAVLSSISQRTRRMIESDLKSKAQVRPVDIVNARKRIVSDVLKLAGEGRIELPKQELEAA